MSTTPSNLTLDDFPATTYQEWREAAEESLKGASFDKKLITRTHEGIDLQPIYNQSDLDALSIPENWPGKAPFLRGSHAATSCPDPWLVAQELPYCDPAIFNEAAKADLMRGQNALNIKVDHATRKGFDTDQVSTPAKAERGLSLSLLADLEKALDGIHIDSIPVTIWAGESAVPLLSAYIALAEKRGITLSSLRGGVLADPLAEWVSNGELKIALPEVYQEMSQTVRWAERAKCPLHTVGVQGGVWADCGATAIEEIAYTLATATEYLRELIKIGISVDEAASRFIFEFSLGSEIFPQISKLRAARLLWWKIVTAFGGKTGAMFIHGRSSIFNKSTLDPHTNMLRATAETFVGAMGGANSMHIAAFDETMRTPDTFSRRIARNAQIILAEECGFSDPVDPAGGSWYIETLTRQIADKAWTLFQEIESKGGMSNALRAGTVQGVIAQSAAKRKAAAASRKDSIIGVNLFPNSTEVPIPAEAEQNSAFLAARRECLREARETTPSAITDIASAIIAWKSGATLGQIVHAMPRSAAPETAITPIRIVRAAEDFEVLRAVARAYASAHNDQVPKIWLANFGPPKQCKARADFSTGFLTPGGFAVLGGQGAKTIEEAVDAAVAADALAVVLCSTDDTYPEIVPAFVPALLAKKPNLRIILAGYPVDKIAEYQALGVHDFIHIRVNCLEFNQKLHTDLGIA